MYVDAKPVSGYGEVKGWKMPQPDPKQKTRPKDSQLRPPFTSSNSSASSLSAAGMEQAVPSFKGFVKRIPKVDKEKALPPLPPYVSPRRSWTGSPSVSVGEASSSERQRRSSSVYSRTVSQWFPVPDSPPPPLPQWNTSDFADGGNLLLLRPIAYSASTPHLPEKAPTPPLLEPRTYSPLINTPSPTASLVTSRSTSLDSEQRSPSGERATVLLPPPPPSASIPKKHLRTVSIEKARAVIHAPGAVHLLPEELRAQTAVPALRKSRSHEGVVVKPPTLMSYADTPPELPSPPVLTDSYGRERIASLTSPMTPLDRGFAFPFPIEEERGSSAATSTFAVGTAPPKAMVPIASQPRKESRAKAAQALGLAEADEQPRGRTRQRGPRNMSYDHYLPHRKSYHSSSSEEDGEIYSHAQKIAKDYHALLTEQYRYSPASSSRRSESDHSIRQHMKLVPQPLFHSKGLKKHASSKFGHSQSSVASSNPTTDSGVESTTQTASSGSHSNVPMKLSLAPDGFYKHERRSTSGTIPISPPIVTSGPSGMQRPTIAVTPYSPLYEQQSQQEPSHPIARRNSYDNRVSAYYPHMMPRKGKNKNKNKGKNHFSASPSKRKDQIHQRKDSAVSVTATHRPLLAADIMAQRLQTPETSPTQFSSHDNPSASQQPSFQPNDVPPAPDNNNHHQEPFYQRFAKSAAKYADLLTRPAGYEPRNSWERKHSFEPITLATVKPSQQQQQQHIATPRASSPHLSPQRHNHSTSHPASPNPSTSAFSPDTDPSAPNSAHPASSKGPQNRSKRDLWTNLARTQFQALQKDKPHVPTESTSDTSHNVLFTPLQSRKPRDQRPRGSVVEGGGKHEPRPSVFEKFEFLTQAAEGKRESRAQKRREELKRLIRVVPEGGGGGGSGEGGMI
ncbi:hypothetical protein MBLNU230_g1143t1 [Neophaeotheca triangularis]